MRIEDFHSLFQLQGGYSLPVLIELRSPSSLSWYFTNNNKDLLWESNFYTATAMQYTPPGSRDGIYYGGSLEITANENSSTQIGHDSDDQELLKWFDTANDKVELIVQAFINEQGEITKLGQLVHRYGTVAWDGTKVTWQLGEDDRLQMLINPYLFDSDALIE